MNCPICGYREFEIIKEYSSADAANHITSYDYENEYKKDVADYIEKNIWIKDRCLFVKCKNCGFEHSEPFTAADSYLYNILYSKSELDKKFWKWDFGIGMEFIKNDIINRLNPKILEIGPGSGHFLKEIIKTIKPINYHAVEYSDDCRSKIEMMGANVYSSLENIDKTIVNSSQYFDYIILFQSLEHIDDIQRLFNKLVSLVKDNGVVIISVPNNTQRKLYESCGLYEDVPPIHISRFDVQDIENISNDFGFELIFHLKENSSFYNKIIRFCYTKWLHSTALKNRRKSLLKNGLYAKTFKIIFLLYTVISNPKHIVSLGAIKGLGTSQLFILKPKCRS